jgi:arginine-tRNA-protein transferase
MRFLCSSPLRNFHPYRKPGVDSPAEQEQKLGSFHQCYRLDGRLIAMSVLDLLPHCVSGVYFIYHSDFERFNFGKISALREAALTLEGGYKYYYMGYYIHSCAKMKYKNEYRPQYVLDLETMGWDELDDEVLKMLDEHHYVSVSHQKDDTPPPLKRKVFGSAKEASDAHDAGLSLFEIEFAGMMTAEELEKTAIDLDKVLVRVKKDVIVQATVRS